MTDLQRRALQIHQRQLSRVTSAEVTYRDGRVVWSGRMVPAQSTFEVQPGDGDHATSVQAADWLIDRDLFLDDADQPIEPTVGARITDETDGDVFEVIPAGANEGYSWGDTRRTRYRIHTRKISEE